MNIKAVGTIWTGSIRLGEAVLVLVLLFARPAFGQTDNSPRQPLVPAMVGVDSSSTPAENNNPDISDDRMATPPPVSGQTYPVMLTSEERSNYLRGGVSFTSAYVDNVPGASASRPVSDITYSVAPTVSLDATTTRLHSVLTYAPGFTFYQRNSGLNEADQNAAIVFEYRLSPHITFSANDGFQKSSNVLNQPVDFSSGTNVSGGAQGPNFSIIPPIADRLSDFGSVGISYQFALNDMVGASGTFSYLHYPNPSQVPGLSDSSSQGGLAFYAHRVAKKQYVGVTYQYQRLTASPTIGQTETQTHAALFFYTASPQRNFSISFFGGPQYSDTTQPPIPALQAQQSELRSWTPAGGASIGWQARLTSLALSYTHVVASSGGLTAAVKQDSAMLSVRQQITRSLNASLGGGYAQNDVIGSASLGLTSGRTVSGTASLQQLLGQHVSVQLGYTRVHQNYGNIQVLSIIPNTNREFISISYLFSRALGR